MDSTQLQTIARDTLEASRGLGFDHLVITVRRQHELGIRIAQSVVCRENVLRESTIFSVSGLWQGRSSTFECDLVGANELARAVRNLRADLELQGADKEAVIPRTPPGVFVWEPTSKGLLDYYSPEGLYRLLDDHMTPIRAKGLRITGYVEATETLAHSFSLSGTELKLRDTGATFTFTVDDGDAKSTGATQRAATHPTLAELDKLIGDALSEAVRIAETSHNPGEMAPGDYTVVMHPSAVLDLINTAIVYGLFDRRKVDEQRTYLSGKLDELRFPEGLKLAQTLSLPLPSGGVYADAPFNSRMMPSESVTLIDGGKIRNLHLSPFWARHVGKSETFSPGNAPPLHLEATLGSPLAGRHKTMKDLIGDTKNGLFIANTWYLRMVAEMDGIITGMTRDGLYEIKDGKLARPVKHMRWHDNPFRVLSKITGMSDEKILLGRSRLAGRSRSPMALMPAVRVENFHFSSVTRF